MSIKLISGLGVFNHPFAVDAHFSTVVASYSPVLANSAAHIIVDTARAPILGNLNVPHIANKLIPSLPQPSFHVTTPPTVPGALHADPSAAGHVTLPPSFTTQPIVAPQLYSLESARANFETFFHEFYIEAVPFYNFWVPDEETNDREERGDRQLEDIPRYIKVVWERAPDLRSRWEGMKQNSTQHQTNRKPVKFGVEAENPHAVVFKGVHFTPQHLIDFAMIKQSVANGHVSPGTVHSVVDMHVNTAGAADPAIHIEEPAHYIDEDAFLTHPEFTGVSLAEIQSVVHTLTNGHLGAGQVSEDIISEGSTDELHHLFRGKFSIEKPTENGGFVHIQGVQADGHASISIKARTCVAQEQNRVVGDQVIDFVRQVAEAQPNRPIEDSKQIRANFISPTLGGALSADKLKLAQRPEHLETAVALAQVLPQLEVMAASNINAQPREINQPTFPSPADMPPLEYCGYLLEKYKLNIDNGVFELVDQIDLASNDYSEYVDTKVLYSAVYRYRIRAYARWTHPENIGIEGPIPTAGGLQQTRSFSGFKSSYFHSEWSKKWSYGIVIDPVPPSPPDELTVIPDSPRKRIMVTFKIPYNEQRDIFYMRLLRKIQDDHGNDLTDWVQVGPKPGYDTTKNVIFYDTHVEYYENSPVKYVYAAQTVTRHGAISGLSDQLAGRLNQKFSIYGEFPVEFVSQQGVKLEHHGAFSTFPFKRFYGEIVVGNGHRMNLSVLELFGNQNMDSTQYWLRAESLDTGEKKDIPIVTRYENLFPKISQHVLGSSVPQTPAPKPQQLITLKTTDPQPVKSNMERAGKDFEPSNQKSKKTGRRFNP